MGIPEIESGFLEYQSSVLTTLLYAHFAVFKSYQGTEVQAPKLGEGFNPRGPYGVRTHDV